MRNLRWNFYIKGLILILLGVLTFTYPLEAILSLGFFIGIGLVASALNNFTAFYFFRLKRFIMLGILDLIAGVVMILQPGLTAFLIPFVIGAWLFSTGIARTCASFWLGGAEVSGWWLMLINGIALIIASLLVCASPLISSISLMIILASVLIVVGVLIIIEGRIMFS